MFGTLFGIGVGPGAPDLLTLRAVKALKEVNVVLGATRLGNEESCALNIAKPYLQPEAQIVQLDFPMTKDQEKLAKAWQDNGQITFDFLKSGLNVAFLTLGDPLIYSTFIYILRAVRKLSSDIPIKIIPGITSFQAACAKMEISLCEQNENMHLISGINSQQVLEEELAQADTAIILKAYRNFATIKKALENCGLSQNCLQASFVEQEGELIQRKLALEEKPPYMTMIVCKKKPD